jgi:hypothetical protein
MYAYYVIKALRGAATARFTLMGWVDLPWPTALDDATAVENHFLEAAVRGQPARDDS